MPDGRVSVSTWNGLYAPERTLARIGCARWHIDSRDLRRRNDEEEQIPEASSGMTEKSVSEE